VVTPRFLSYDTPFGNGDRRSRSRPPQSSPTGPQLEPVVGGFVGRLCGVGPLPARRSASLRLAGRPRTGTRGASGTLPGRGPARRTRGPSRAAPPAAPPTGWAHLQVRDCCQDLPLIPGGTKFGLVEALAGRGWGGWPAGFTLDKGTGGKIRGMDFWEVEAPVQKAGARVVLKLRVLPQEIG
jgi:hypothetical protein